MFKKNKNFNDSCDITVVAYGCITIDGNLYVVSNNNFHKSERLYVGYNIAPNWDYYFKSVKDAIEFKFDNVEHSDRLGYNLLEITLCVDNTGEIKSIYSNVINHVEDDKPSIRKIKYKGKFNNG